MLCILACFLLDLRFPWPVFESSICAGTCEKGGDNIVKMAKLLEENLMEMIFSSEMLNLCLILYHFSCKT